MTFELKMRTKIKLIETIKNKMESDTALFLETASGQLPDISIRYRGITVNIPIDTPETNEAVDEALNNILESVKEAFDCWIENR